MPIARESCPNDTRIGLEGMRKRLLDLTGNNRLLNFKFTKNGSLRFTQASLDRLIEHLYAEQVSLLSAVPKARQKPRWDVDEDEDNRKNSPAGPRHLIHQSPDGGEPARRSGAPSAVDVARQAGISTSFDLDGQVADDPSRLQALFYPEDLEKIARKISGAARTAIEETGSNLLHLIFGFLEWYESDDSEAARLAPLLTLTVNLQKAAADPATGITRYFLETAGGERLSANYCLEELLRQDFNLQLPTLRAIGEEGEIEAPESYFRRVEAVIASKERWKIRRQLTLGLLSFGKLLMHRDLDPQTWPAGDGPDVQARVRDLFEGISREGPPELSPEYPLDEPAMRARVPELVLDADSSQHSALIDALEGKNLVIQGPPGTGKSQTITNLIAAALVRGKSVLFVAEKLAALEVVRNRLDHINLGVFCLELHSHKTQKRTLLEDVQERLKLQGRIVDDPRYTDRLTLLEDQKRRLNDYAVLIQQKYGERGQTLHDLLWAMERARIELGEGVAGAGLDTINIAGAERMSSAHVEERGNALDAYGQHLAIVLAEAIGGLKAHPWAGITDASLTFQEIGDLVRRLHDFQQETRNLAERSVKFGALYGWNPVADTPRKVLALVDEVRRLPTPDEADSSRVFCESLPNLSLAEQREHLVSFAARVDEHIALCQRVVTVVGPTVQLRKEQTDVLRKVLEAAEKSCPVAVEVKDIAAVAEHIRWHAERLRELTEPLASFCRRLGVEEVPERLDALHTIQAVLELAESAPREDLHLGGLLPDTATAGPFVREARREAEPVVRRREGLSERFQLHAVPASTELDRLATVAANAGIFSFLSGEFRSAKRAYLGWKKAGKSFTRADMRGDCQELSEFRQAEARFAAKGKFQVALGKLFEGLDTPFEQVERVVGWHEEVARLLAHGEPPESFPARCARALALASPTTLRSIEELRPVFTATPHGGWKVLHESLEECLRSYLPEEIARPTNFTALAAMLQSFAEKLMSFVGEFTAAGFTLELSLAQMKTVLDDLDRLSDVRQSVESDADAKGVLGKNFQGCETDAARVRSTVELAGRLSEAEVSTGVRTWLLQADAGERLGNIRRSALELAETLVNWEKNYQAFAGAVGLDLEGWLEAKGAQIEHASFDTVSARASRALAAESSLINWITFLRARRQVVSLKLGVLTERAEDGRLPTKTLRKSYMFIFHQSVMRALFKAYPALEEFSGLTHEDVRRRFANLDSEVMGFYQRRAAYQIAARPVPYGVSSGPVGKWTNVALLEREITKQKRHIPIRQLVDRAGPALKALKPCFMMSPMSVAQYLKPGGFRFDLVVMDEASQLKPEDAMGAIARGGQLVVVGDPMQLPPTNFFDRMADGAVTDDDDVLAVDEAESILDIASTIYQPLRRLRWHYRSRHESLIAFSNHEFYDGDLIVFPSPVVSDEWLGVKFVHVAAGLYQDRCNRREAEQVVAAALKHMRERPQESLGVVALNIVQKELIEDLFEKASATDPIASRFLETAHLGLEPFFIKNLENVQGDERDVIFISVAYGPAAPGAPVQQRFGPINGSSGHRRLNVLFTRAKQRVVVFSSMTADDLRIDEKTPRGTRVLRDYLAYAKAGGQLEEQSTPTGREPDSDFEISVAAALRRHGYEVVPQVGVAGYFIDLAVRNLSLAGSFLLGIECDGATYHRSHSARDRDRLRQSVLERLGWKIHRIWSTDWFKQPSRETEKIITRLRALSQSDEIVSPDKLPAIPEQALGARQEETPVPRKDAMLASSQEKKQANHTFQSNLLPAREEMFGELFRNPDEKPTLITYDKARKSYRDWTDRLIADQRFGRSVGEEMVKWAITGLQMGLGSRSLSFLAGLEMPLDQEEAATLFLCSVRELAVPHAT